MVLGIFAKHYERLLRELDSLKSSLANAAKKDGEEHRRIDSSIASLKNEIKRAADITKKDREEFQRIDASIRALKTDIKRVTDAARQDREEYKRINASINSLKNELKRVERNLQIKGMRHLNPFRHSEYYDSFKIAFTSPEFPERYLALVRCLDEESLETVIGIIARLQQNFEKGEPHWRIYTDKEKKLHEKIYDELTSRIVQLASDMFCYKGYILPRNEFDAGVFFFNYGLQYIKDITYTGGKHVIDAGAFIGDSLLLLSPLTTKSVHCFEAHPANHADLLKTIEMNAITNALPVSTAVGGMNGEVVIRGREDLLPAVTMDAVPRYIEDENKKDLEFELTVPLRTLDSYVEQHEIEIGLIKVDIEGAESEFLQGAKQTIQRDRPILLLSIYHTADDFLDIKPLLEKWNLGYSFKIIPGSENILSGTLLIADPSGGGAIESVPGNAAVY